ncbi:hypothetical protein BX666DRAFT_84307 [Dichotomocladium elegans]|nr:hypothetical protein BX666DRAFT_84307 [Dichotomocladium elegans]
MRNVAGRTLGLLMKAALSPCGTNTQTLFPKTMRCRSCGSPMRSARSSFPGTTNRWLTLSMADRQQESRHETPRPQQQVELRSERLIYLENAISQLALKGRANDALQKYLQTINLQLLPSQETLYQLYRVLYRQRDLTGLYMATPLKQPVNMSAIIRLCKEMVEFRLANRVALYNSLINMLAERGEHDNCNTLFEHMKKWGIQPDMYTYGAMLKACACKKDLAGMEQLLDDMYNHGITIDRAIVSTLVTALCRARQFETAEKVVAQLSKYNAGNRALMNSVFRDELYRNIERWKRQREKKRQRMLRWRTNTKNKRRKKA